MGNAFFPSPFYFQLCEIFFYFKPCTNPYDHFKPCTNLYDYLNHLKLRTNYMMCVFLIRSPIFDQKKKKKKVKKKKKKFEEKKKKMNLPFQDKRIRKEK